MFYCTRLLCKMFKQKILKVQKHLIFLNFAETTQYNKVSHENKYFGLVTISKTQLAITQSQNPLVDIGTHHPPLDNNISIK